MDAGDLRLLPFRGSIAVAAGWVTWGKLRGPGWRRLLPDVYVASGVPLDHRLWCHAALLYGGADAAISGLTAARLWGALIGRAGDPVELTVPTRRVLRCRSMRIHIVRANIAPAELDAFSGLTLTAPLRTLSDVVKRAERSEAVITAEAMLRRGLITGASLEAAAWDRYGTRLGRVIAEIAAVADARSESPMETRTRLIMIDGGLPCPAVQLDVFDERGRFVARLDLAYEECKIGIEYEGDHHRARATFQNDLARLNKLVALGWVIVRVSARDIYREPDQLVRQLKALIADRSPRSS